MSDRYGHINNRQANNVRAYQAALGSSVLGISKEKRLNTLFGNPKDNFGYSGMSEGDSSVKSKFDVDNTEAGKQNPAAGDFGNPDFINGVNLNYVHPDAPSFKLEEAIESGDSALHGAPNIAVPPGSVSNPSLEREGSFAGNIENYPTYDPANRDGGGFGNFDASKNVPATHRESVGSYLQTYTRGQASNFGNSTN